MSAYYLILCHLSSVNTQDNTCKVPLYGTIWRKKYKCGKEKKNDGCAYHLDRELELVVHLRHQEIMAQSLSHLHDPHNGSINLILTILKDSLCGAGLLLHLG